MHKRYGRFEEFVANVIRRSHTRTATILVALLYLKRAKFDLDIPPVQLLLHRLFLGALILATKVRHISRHFREYPRLLIPLSQQYTLDAAPRNSDWAAVTGMFGRRDIGTMEFQMFQVLDMKLSFTEKELKELRLDILGAYETELAHLADPKPPPAPITVKTPRSRSPDLGDLPSRKRAKFIVEEDDESDSEPEGDFEPDRLYYESELEDPSGYLSPPQLSSSISSSSTSSAVTPPESLHPVKLTRSHASANLYAGLKSRFTSYSPQSWFSPTIEVPMVEPGTAVENFTKSSAVGWQLLQWFKPSPWATTRR